MILFALCSLQRNLAAHQKWDFSLLSRFSSEFQKGSWCFLLVFIIIFRKWSLSWGSPGGLWTSSALRQATSTFSWCHYNICDFLTWINDLIHAFKSLLYYLYSVGCLFKLICLVYRSLKLTKLVEKLKSKFFMVE